MTRAISKPHFILLFMYVIFIAHTLAEPPEAVKKEFMAWRKRSHEARLSGRTNRSLQSSNVTGFQKPHESDMSSTIWAGAVQSNSPSGTFSTVSADWDIPTIDLPSGATGSNIWGVSQWVGIDGSLPSPCPNSLAQAGTWTWLQADEGSILNAGVGVWYEWWPDEAVYLSATDYPVTFGDPITVYVGASSPSQAIATWSNQVTGQTQTRQFSSPDSPGTDICGGTAEWISETPNENGWELADFGNIQMQACQATTTNQDSVDLTGSTLTYLVDSNGNIIVSTSFVSNYALAILFVADEKP